MKKYLLLLFSALYVAASAQFVNIKQIPSSAGGGNSVMGMYGKQYTQSNNFLLAFDEMAGSKNFVKFNAQGDTVYARKRDNSYNIDALTEINDGSVYALNLNQDSLISNKINAQGYRVWKRKIALPAGGNWYGLAARSSGTDNIFCIGSSYWPAGGHALIGKLDSSGAVSFCRSIDMTSWFGANLTGISPIALRTTSTGNILMMGGTYTNGGTPMYLFLIMMDQSGNVLWTKTYQTGVGGGPQSFFANTLELTAGDEILIGGSKQSSGTSYMRLDQNGNFLWGKNIADNANGGAQLIPLSNGDLALHMANSNQVPDLISKNMISVLDPSGNVKLTRAFGYAGGTFTGAIGQNATGHITGFGHQNTNMQLIFYSMDTAGTSTGCYDVISTLPVTSFTANFISQTLTSTAETFSGPFNGSVTQHTGGTFNKSTPGMQTNGSITPPLCYGTFGSVTLNPTGGSSPYAFSWSNGTNSQNLLNVPGAVYVVRMADNMGCVELDTFNVVEPAQLSATYTVSHVTCFGTQNGSVNVTTTGGTPGYDYQWTTLATTEDLNGLSGGFYQLTITDINNCSKTVAVAVSEPQQLIAGIISSQNVTCYGACNGSLTGIASGGTQPYTYQWNNPGNSTTTNISGLCPGNYLFSVTDSKNCFTFSNAVITEPAALNMAINSSGSLCGDSTGTASSMVTGGVSPYSYQWSSGTANDTALSLPSGSHTVVVTDANSCTISSVVNVGITTPTPDICLVTVDSLSSHNILMWDKTAFTNVDYFNIYREDITNNYTLIAAVDYDSLSEYHDLDMNMADPNVTTKRYKMSAVDTCGNESAKSNFHNTIFIAHNNGTFTWNTYTIQNSANPVTNYVLMRDDLANGNWIQVGTTAGTQNVLNDPNYATFQATADWRVETIWNITCTSTLRESNGAAATLVKSKSNITNNRVVGITQSSGIDFGMYPNPANESLTIVLDKATSCSVEVNNSLGETIRKVNLSGNDQINISELANGVYYVKILSEGKQLGIKKLVVQR